MISDALVGGPAFDDLNDLSCWPRVYDVSNFRFRMTRGIEILASWLIVVILVDSLIIPHSIPKNGFETFFDIATIVSFPLAVWFYARHSNKIIAVIIYGMIAGVFCVFVPLPFFYDSRGLEREFTIGLQVAALCASVFMALTCVGIFALCRFIQKKI